MGRIKTGCDLAFDNFIISNPDLVDEVADWYPSAQYEITVKMFDGRKLAYNMLTDSVYKICDDVNLEDEIDFIDKDEWADNFGMQLSRKIKMLGMSRSEVAYKMGFDETRLSRYINGRIMPSGYVVDKFAEVLKCSPAELMWRR